MYNSGPTETNGNRQREAFYLLLYSEKSATAEVARDADDVDYKFSKVTVHLIKKCHRIALKFTQFYTK